MSDLTVKCLKHQGKKAKAIYPYKATMNDELSLRVDDIIVITQSSEDETWYEGTLNGRTGWFPSNYVQVIEEVNDEANNTQQHINQIQSQQSNDENIRIKYINELRLKEEEFLDEMCKFVKLALIPLQSTGNEIFSTKFIQNLNSNIDEIIRCHQTFFNQLKEMPENSDAKIGNIMLLMAPQFKQVYDLDIIGNLFESSLSKMNSPILPTTSSMPASIYITKFLVAPFKQIEIYVKFLKEIHRHSEDYHVDRGDVQRSIEFYSDLSTNNQEMRRKKECELDIMTSRVNNIDDDLFINGESIFLSTVLIINEQGERKDRIMILFPSYLIILSQNLNKQHDFDFEAKIPLQNGSNLIQAKRVNNLEQINTFYGGNLLTDPLAMAKYSFELIGVQCSNASFTNRLLIICSINYDLKMWLETLQTQINKSQTNKPQNTKQQQQQKMPDLISNSPSFKSGSQQKLSSSSKCLSPSSGHLAAPRRTFSMRPHPPLIPHFQLPSDVNPTVLQFNSNNDPSATLKRFMYKKPKLSEPFGKYHGADDDLKLLNLIESFCKAKVRQSLNINVQEAVAYVVNKSAILPLPQRANDSDGLITTANGLCSPTPLEKNTNSLNRGENNNNQLNNELNELKRSNKELKSMLNNLQKQLECERSVRRKLENYIRKQQKNNELPTLLMMNVEHESSI